MKNASWLLVPLFACVLTPGCKDKGCGNSVNAVQPNTNPAGYEVLLKTTGFSSAAKVYFGEVQATSRAGGESDDIIAKVPAGLSGNVEISVEEGDCIARSAGFVVSNGLPNGVQPSLQDIVVPVPVAAPLGDITNGWENAVAGAGGIFIQVDLVAGINQLTNGNEFSSSDPSLQSNPVNGTINTNTNVISLIVDRTSNGGGIEHLDGKFIAIPNSLLAEIDPKTSKNYVIFLVSQESGRQLILYFPG